MKSREILRILIIKMEENRRNLKVKFLDIELKKRKSFIRGREVFDGALRPEEGVIRE